MSLFTHEMQIRMQLSDHIFIQIGPPPHSTGLDHLLSARSGNGLFTDALGVFELEDSIRSCILFFHWFFSQERRFIYIYGNIHNLKPRQDSVTVPFVFTSCSYLGWSNVLPVGVRIDSFLTAFLTKLLYFMLSQEGIWYTSNQSNIKYMSLFILMVNYSF